MIKRYSQEELSSMLVEMGIEELATATKRWECLTVAEESSSIFRMALDVRLCNGKVYRTRIKDFHEKANEPEMFKSNADIYNEAASILDKICSDDEKSDMEYQKELYAKEENIYTSRSYLEFPLDKRINAIYDTFSAVYLFYDNIATLKNNKLALYDSYEGDKEAIERFARNLLPDTERMSFLSKSAEEQRSYLAETYGKDYVDRFESITDVEQRKDYVRKNIEFTHCMLGGADNPSYGIGVFGKMDPKFTQFDSNQQALTPEWCDFNKVTLADTMKIQKQDLMQIVQSKIDIDRENLEVVDERNIRGDVYRLVKAPGTIRHNGTDCHYFIRYVCPSTGRVYHDIINERSLRISKFFDAKDPKTFLNAWWSINNAGDDPTIELEVIRC